MVYKSSISSSASSGLYFTGSSIFIAIYSYQQALYFSKEYLLRQKAKKILKLSWIRRQPQREIYELTARPLICIVFFLYVEMYFLCET